MENINSENIDNNINIKMCVLIGGVIIAISVMIFLHIYGKSTVINDLKNKNKFNIDLTELIN